MLNTPVEAFKRFGAKHFSLSNRILLMTSRIASSSYVLNHFFRTVSFALLTISLVQHKIVRAFTVQSPSVTTAVSLLDNPLMHKATSIRRQSGK
jgi:hypothetical protein